MIVLGSYLGGSFGIFAVYVGHNFETAYWAQSENVNRQDAALIGASVLELGWLPDFALLNFGYHDLHHLNVRIPSYRLKDCHHALTDQLGMTKITLWEARRCLRWRLWDERDRKMVPFSTGLLQDLAGGLPGRAQPGSL